MWSERSERAQEERPQPQSVWSVGVAKKLMKKAIQVDTLANWNEKVKKLTFHGDFDNLFIEEQENVTWKSVSNNMPKGIYLSH